MSGHDSDKKIGWHCKKCILGQKTSFLAPKSFFSMLRPYIPLISPQTDLTQWDHNLPMSWDNSGYLRFSSRCPFGCSVGRFLALIAQNGPFWAKNPSFWPWRPPIAPIECCWIVGFSGWAVSLKMPTYFIDNIQILSIVNDMEDQEYRSGFNLLESHHVPISSGKVILLQAVSTTLTQFPL